MNKLLKIALSVTAVVVGLFVAATLYAVFFFNANDYRNEIDAQVKAATGRNFHVGSMHLSLLPVLGLKLDDAVLGNPKGFGGAPFAKVGKAAIGVQLWPLIVDHRLEIGSIYLSGLDLTLRRKVDGKDNWVGLLGTQRTKKLAVEVPSSKKSSGSPIWSVFAIAGLRVENASIHYEDAVRGRTFSLTHVDLSAGPLRPENPCSFRISFVTRSNRPALTADIASSGDLIINPSAHYLSLKDYRLRVVAGGPSVPTGRQSTSLHGDADYNSAKGVVKLKHITLDLAGVTSRISGLIRHVGAGEPTWSATLHIEPFNPSDALRALGVRDYYPNDASALKKASLSAEASGSLHEIKLTHLSFLLDQTTISGTASARLSAVPVIVANLKVNNINVDRYMPVVNVRSDHSGTSTSPQHASGRPLPFPLPIFGGTAGHYHVTVQRLIVHGVKLSHANVRVDIASKGDIDASLGADLYGGKTAGLTQFNPTKTPDYRQSFSLTHVSIGPLLQDFSGRDPVSGQGNVRAELTGTGRTVSTLKRSLDGVVSVDLRNGAIKGFNLAGILRSLQNPAQLNGQSVLSGEAHKTQETDFSSLSASGHISKGILTSTDLAAASPFLRASGSGRINLVKETIDYTVYPMLVNTATGQGGKHLSQLHGIEIPVRITGRLSAPHYKVALGALLRRSEKQGLRQLLNRKNTTLRDRLKQIFGF